MVNIIRYAEVKMETHNYETKKNDDCNKLLSSILIEC